MRGERARAGRLVSALPPADEKATRIGGREGPSLAAAGVVRLGTPFARFGLMGATNHVGRYPMPARTGGECELD
jgi:hypothetical protein